MGHLEESRKAPYRVPTSTYRLQLHRAFRLCDVAALVPYLDALGVGACYFSPLVRAGPGSTHGYDTWEYGLLNPDLGTPADLDELSERLEARGMGALVDFVPNHMSAAAGNPWWRDVLENGRCSPFAAFFDIDWTPVKTELRDKLLLPILGDQYGAVLERGELRLRLDDSGALCLDYFENELPIDPRQCASVLERGLEAVRHDLGDEDAHYVELLSVTTALRNLPAHTESDERQIAERHREKEVARRRLHDLLAAAPGVRTRLREAVDAMNGVVGRPESFDALHTLLEAQPYRLSYWRTASHEINYRRFFDINELAAVRMENPEVFAAAHALLLDWIASGRITGLRLDHVDGLFDPQSYLDALQAAIRSRCPVAANRAGDAPRFYVVVEKILSAAETLPRQWPVAGTTGYDYLTESNGLFVDRRQQRELSRVYRRFTGRREPYADILYASKKLIMDGPMASELNVLAHTLNRISELDRRSRDFTLNSLREALREVVACFPIYRSYVSGRSTAESDRVVIETAIRHARRRNPTVDPSIFAFVRDALLPSQERLDPRTYQARLRFAMKFQQYTGPVEAKGREDTSFYRYNLLAAQNDVGGDPASFGTSPAEFHAANQRRQTDWPHGLLATSTHDTKRSEDARARLDVLSEMPREWGACLSRWSRLNAANRRRVGEIWAPDRNDEYLFYQSLLGIWPNGAARASDELVSRLVSSSLKAAREAKVHTSWLNQEEEYEQALTRFIERTLRGPSAARFVAAFLPLQQRVAALGMVSSLAQVVLKCVSPGVPDFYQGSEVWDYSLVDPDNRRPVDYASRAALLASLEPLLAVPTAEENRDAALRRLLDEWHDGRVKLYLTAALLRARRRLRSLFEHGQYAALEGVGPGAEHALALARWHGRHAVIAVVPRLCAVLAGADGMYPWRAAVWQATRVPLPPPLRSYTYSDLFTGRRRAVGGEGALDLGELFAGFPVVVLFGTAEEGR